MSTPKRCISWIAVSSDDQAAPDRESLPDQRRRNLEFIQSLGRYYQGEAGNLVEELEVVGTRSIIRFDEAVETYPAYRRLEELIRNRAFDLLVCRKRDRLGRETALVATIESLCMRAGILVVPRDSLPASLDAHSTGQDEGRRIVSLLESHLAGAEVREFVRRSRVGKERRVRDGKFVAKVPWGWTVTYDAAGKALVEIDPQAASALRFALLECFLERNMSFRAVARAMNERGFRTPRGRLWDKGPVRNIFSLVDRYAGIAEYNRQSKRGGSYLRSAGKWPPILTPAERDAVRAEMERRHVPVSYNYERLFSRVALCDRCGGSIVVSKAHDSRRPLQKMVTYRCTNKCQGSHVTEGRMDEALRDRLEWLSDPINRQAIAADMPDHTDSIRKLLNEAQAELDRLAEQRRRADHAYVVLGSMSDEGYGEIMEAVNRQTRTAQARKDQLEAGLKDAEDARRIGDRLEEAALVGPSYLDGDPAAANAWMRRNFRLYIRDNRVSRIENL